MSPTYRAINTVEELFSAFESRTNLERTTTHLRFYRLERMEALLTRLENPHRAIPVVHIAGSKGKGSTAAYTTSLLAAGGLTVGLYTSPHIESYLERFMVIPPGVAVGEGDPSEISPPNARILLEQGRRVWGVVEELITQGVSPDDLPTTFELLTALAFCYFPAVGCQWIVLETGLGGRLDATNVCLPALTIITRIELEHTDYLGTTLPRVAGEKAGIIKRGAPLIYAPQEREVEQVLLSTARDRDVPVREVEPLSKCSGRDGALSGERVLLPRRWEKRPISLSMIGPVHRTNAAVALMAIETLIENGRIAPINVPAVVHAVETTHLPGRGEMIEGILFDGAHTTESARSITASIVGAGIPLGDIPVILGVVAGKNVEGIVRHLSRVTNSIIVSRPGRFKPGDPQDVLRRTRAYGLDATLLEEPHAALDEARRRTAAKGTPGGLIVVTGSFYMVAEVRRVVRQGK